MMKFKRFTAISMAFLLIFPTTLASATSGASSSDKNGEAKSGTYSEKSEVVYANLSANGEQEEMYVVNNFSVDQQGKLTDYGPYTSVENLTNLKEIHMDGNKVEFEATEDQFYYQGNLNKKPLPWDINISYKLDGKKVNPEEISGEDGKFAIQIKTKKNEKADSAFFENYMLQISLPLDSEIYQNIKTENGMIANAGKNKQVTFTVMPGKEETFVVKADVTDLEMAGIEITGMPSSMSIEEPDSGEMTEDMKSLSDATAEINDGVADLNDGISELNEGAARLQEGSADYKKGIKELDSGSSDMINGSEEIKNALNQMSQSLESGSGEDNSSNLNELKSGLQQIAGGLEETETGLSQTNQRLGQLIGNIPDYDISKEEIDKLNSSNADSQVINQLVETYKAAQTVRTMYFEGNGEKQPAIGPSIENMVKSLQKLKDEIDGIVKSLENSDRNKSMQELQQGLSQLSSNYKEFHSGLVEYTGGVSELSTSYGELHGGITDLTDGTGELENGVNELHEGTTDLAESTRDLPDEMQNEIDSMMNEYDKSDFDPVSFVSPKNEKVNNVQFVIKTESIKKDDNEQENEKEEQEEEKGFWDRLLDLFQ
ncbi:YhgE/Pip domain-containing protein [Virgibacillus sp. MSP4-1]|uniref:YhgE/Pip domain-containing protein n=1 Tax=Virgibacillus sp. MSP4-1 TaxID=2700081 RepID=UPI00039E0C16|nr:YhgE/Pip domain-containing protein [Virgibacillus sp. MSP4-1]